MELLLIAKGDINAHSLSGKAIDFMRTEWHVEMVTRSVASGVLRRLVRLLANHGPPEAVLFVSLGACRRRGYTRPPAQNIDRYKVQKSITEFD